MWVFAMFDLPVQTQAARAEYTRFRTLLLRCGFDMMQFSVYARYYPSEEASAAHRKIIKKGLPPDGQVRLLMVTDKQYGKMEIFHGKKHQPTELPPDQMMLF
ncbi:MAG: CRISPR-associated endonuclease Cas2 [Candidatus Hydrogenedens sp.]|nr:CRISPR-associated endonuclease Cas2 [Candidatus Hydrogenedens sp.]